MAQLPLINAIPRFKGNEDRIDKFTNGTAAETWQTSGGVTLPTLAKFLADNDEEISEAADSAAAAATSAAAAATSAATSQALIQALDPQGINDDAFAFINMTGQVVTAQIADGAITDTKLAAPANITYLNQTATTADFYGGDVVEMFSVSPAREFSLGPQNFEFNTSIIVPTGRIIKAHRDALFVPTFEPVGVARGTPLIDLGDGVSANSLRMHLEAGINTIRKGFRLGNYCQVGYIEATSTDLNNNRTEAGSTDLVSGAVLIDGDRVRVGQMHLNRFDRGWAVVDSNDVIISKIRNLETVMGGYVHGSRDIHVFAALTSGPTDPNEPNSMGRGIMTPGANSLVLAGCSDSSFSNWHSQDMLEHAIRVGGIASGTTVPNERIAFTNIKSFRPYGCGFKMDDGDAFLIKRILIRGLFTEDVGHNNWFGSPGYQNWSAGGANDPLTDNDGNKVAFAIRNSQHVTFSDFSNKINLYADSGYFGLWIERSNYIQGSNIDTEQARHDGVVIQSGGGTSPERIELRGVATRDNTDSGLLYDATPSNASWRGVMIYELDSQNNGGYGVEVTGRLDGASPFVTLTSRIEGFVRGNTLGSTLIDADVAVDPDFVTDLKIPEGRTTYDPPSLADAAGVTTTVTVTGAALGDTTDVSFSNDLQGLILTSWVSAANTVSVRFQNETGGVVDLGAGTLKVRVRK